MNLYLNNMPSFVFALLSRPLMFLLLPLLYLHLCSTLSMIGQNPFTGSGRVGVELKEIRRSLHYWSLTVLGRIYFFPFTDQTCNWRKLAQSFCLWPFSLGAFPHLQTISLQHMLLEIRSPFMSPDYHTQLNPNGWIQMSWLSKVLSWEVSKSQRLQSKLIWPKRALRQTLWGS